MGLPLPSTSGIKTFEPAVLFAVLYAILVLLYVRETAHNPTYVFIVLVIFCVFRVVGFILHAILAASDGAKENDGLVIADTVFFTAGFVGLLYSVFMLLLNRVAAAQNILGESEDRPGSGILSLILSRRLIDLIFTVAAGVSIAAAAYIASDWDESERLSMVAAILYLYITICLCLHAAILVYKEKKALRLGLRQRTPLGQVYAVYLHCPILLFLLIREAYLLATFGPRKDRRNIESYWYPLFATPELLAACLFSAPGLVPRPEELPEEDKERSYWSRLWRAYNTNG